MSAPAMEGLVSDVCRGLRQIADLMPSPLRRLRVQQGDTVIELEWREPAVPAPPGAPGLPTAADRAPTPDAIHHVRAPMVGTFYHAPEPGAEPFVRSGDVVQKGQQIGVIEAMKLMNPVEADRSGRVTEVLVPDATPVEFDQPLLAVEPVAEVAVAAVETR